MRHRLKGAWKATIPKGRYERGMQGFSPTGSEEKAVHFPPTFLRWSRRCFQKLSELLPPPSASLPTPLALPWQF